MANALSVMQVAERRNVDARATHRVTQSAKLPAFKVGRQWQFLRDDVDAWIDRRSPRFEPKTIPLATESTPAALDAVACEMDVTHVC